MRFTSVDVSLVAMADRKTFSRYNMRCGLVLKAKEAGVKLIGFDLPQLDQRFLAITGKDLQDRNTFSLLGDTMPLLAVDKIDYIGQPLLALFGPDSESVELLMDRIAVKTEPLEEIEKKTDRDIPPLSFSWGQEDIPEDEALSALKQVESSFHIDHTPLFSLFRYNVTAWQEGNTLHIQAPMQWPELVRETIVNNTGKEKRNVVLHNLKYHSKHDEYLIYPAIYATLAAIASIETGLPVDIRAIGESARAGVEVNRKTYLNEENRPVIENVIMIVDQGAFSFAGAEYQRQAMAGLLPIYTVKSFSATIEIIKSQNPPASFCGSLGYSEALASTECHTSRLAIRTGTTPAQIRETLGRGKTRFTDYAPPHILNATTWVQPIVESSVFNRKWSSNSFHHGDFGLLGKLRGIGLATGLGIAGFSTSQLQKQDFYAVMSYTAKKNITINSSVAYNPNITRYWREIITSKLSHQEDAESVLFLEQNSETADSGPDVLSRFPYCFSSQLATAAKSMGALIPKSKAPIQLKFKAEGGSSPCEFEYSGFGSMIIEIEISKKDYLPVVKEAWGSFSLSDSSLKDITRSSARRTILSTLKECGAELSKNFKLNISFIPSDDPEDENAPIKSVARGLTMGAFSNALYQAAGESASVLPTSAEKLEAVLNGGK